MRTIFKSAALALAAFTLASGCQKPKAEEPRECILKPWRDRLIAQASSHTTDVAMSGGQQPGTTQRSQIPGGGPSGGVDAYERRHHEDNFQMRTEARRKATDYELPFCDEPGT